MLHEYLRKVASRYSICLTMKEYNHASTQEEVGSRNDTLYVTNVRDPVDRSVSRLERKLAADVVVLIPQCKEGHVEVHAASSVGGHGV